MRTIQDFQKGLHAWANGSYVSRLFTQARREKNKAFSRHLDILELWSAPL